MLKILTKRSRREYEKYDSTQGLAAQRINAMGKKLMAEQGATRQDPYQLAKEAAENRKEEYTRQHDLVGS